MKRIMHTLRTGGAILILSMTLAAPGSTAGAPAQDAPLTAPDGMDATLWDRLEKLDLQASGIDSFTADFTQLRYTPLLKKPLKSSGKVLVKGARILWDTRDPRPTKMLITDEDIQLYYPGENLLEIYRLGDRLGELTTSPVPRLETLLKYFRLQAIAVDSIDDSELAQSVRDGGIIALRMEPHDEELAEHILTGEVFIQVDGAFARKMVMTDVEGEQTVLLYDNVRLNPPIPDAMLTVNAPNDVVVSRPLEDANETRHDGDHE